jgi:5'-nucleotidase (lipoprotein e(P4) family)
MTRWLLALALVPCLAGAPACRTAAPLAPPGPAAPAATPSVPPAPATVAPALRWVRDSAERRALFLQVYRAATARVEHEAASRPPGTWGVVLDADETVLDNSLYELERAQAGAPFSAESWRTWCARREATPLPGAAAFLTRVRELGGRIAIVTNRTFTECPDTEDVFRVHGLACDVMLCRPDGGPSDKNPRFEAVARGATTAPLPPLEIVAFVGDDIRDFPGQDQSLRERADEAFAAFGTRFFVLPNPLYGSWQR